MFKYVFVVVVVVLLLVVLVFQVVVVEFVNVSVDCLGCYGGGFEVWYGDFFVGCVSFDFGLGFGFLDGGGGGFYGGGGGFSDMFYNIGDYLNQCDVVEKSLCDEMGELIVVGDLVVFFIGNEVFVENDFVSVGNMGFLLIRMYNYFWNGIGIFGCCWLSNYDYKLLFIINDLMFFCYMCFGNIVCDFMGKFIWVLCLDGCMIKFNYVSLLLLGWYEDKVFLIVKIFKLGSIYVLYSEDYMVEIYDVVGFFLSI